MSFSNEDLKDMSDYNFKILYKEITKLQDMITVLDTKVDNVEKRLAKLDDHIDFINTTYNGLKDPLLMASKFFKRG